MVATKLHADDKPTPVFAPGNGKTKTARLWTYVRDDRPSGDTAPAAVWFAYTQDRKGIHPRTHLAGFSGVPQPMHMLASTRLTKTARSKRPHAWAHARRKFYDLHESRPTDKSGPAPPLLDDLVRWLRAAVEKLSRKSDTSAAILYSLNLWPALTRYCDDGAIEIDNSAAERALRGVAIGRRNYLLRAPTPVANVPPPSTR